tara:strand:- start:79 stop:762 length:684 start_codon:yes stop_codon:yes gene_type:complete
MALPKLTINELQERFSLTNFKTLNLISIDKVDAEVFLIDLKTQRQINFSFILVRKTLDSWRNKSLHNALNVYVNRFILLWDNIRISPQSAKYVNKKDGLMYSFLNNTLIEDIDRIQLVYYYEIERFDPFEIAPTNLDQLYLNARVIISNGNETISYDVNSSNPFGPQINQILLNLNCNRLDQMTILHQEREFLCTSETIEYFDGLTKTTKLCVRIKGGKYDHIDYLN